MLVVVEEARLSCKLHTIQTLVVDAALRVRREKLGLLDVSSVHLVQLPPVAVGVQAARVLYVWIYLTHVLETPDARTNHLLHRKHFHGLSATFGHHLGREEDGNQREAYASLICLAFHVGDAHMIATVPLVEEAVDVAVKLAKGAGFGLESKTDIKGCVSGGLDENQLGECHDVLVSPHLCLFELFNFVQKLLG